MSITIQRAAYGRVVTDSTGNVIGLYNGDGSILYLRSTGTAIPLLASTPTSSVLIDAGTSNTVSDFRFTINPGDDVIGGQRLLSSASDETYTMTKGTSYRVVSSSPIVKFYGAGISSSTTYSSSNYVIGSAETDLADAMAECLLLDLTESDNITEIILTYTAGTTTQTANLYILGIKHG